MLENISIIIPTYNRSYSILSSIESIYKQTIPFLEIIVVDDHSQDDTLLQVSKYFPLVTLLKNSKNRGVSYSRNRGVTYSKGDWVTFLDSDDQWKSQKLENQILGIQQENTSISFSKEQWIHHNMKRNPPKAFTDTSNQLLYSFRQCVIPISGILLKKDIFKRIGGFNEELTICEDYLFILELLLNYGTQISQTSSPGVIRFSGNNRLSSKYPFKIPYQIKALELLYKKYPLKKDLILPHLQKKVLSFHKGIRSIEEKKEASRLLKSYFN